MGDKRKIRTNLKWGEIGLWAQCHVGKSFIFTWAQLCVPALIASNDRSTNPTPNNSRNQSLLKLYSDWSKITKFTLYATVFNCDVHMRLYRSTFQFTAMLHIVTKNNHSEKFFYSLKKIIYDNLNTSFDLIPLTRIS